MVFACALVCAVINGLRYTRVRLANPNDVMFGQFVSVIAMAKHENGQVGKSGGWVGVGKKHNSGWYGCYLRKPIASRYIQVEHVQYKWLRCSKTRSGDMKWVPRNGIRAKLPVQS